MVIAYSFDLKTNELGPQRVPSPNAGMEHLFRAWRLKGAKPEPVSMRHVELSAVETDDDDEQE